MQLPSYFKALPAKLFLSSLLLFPFTDVFSQALIITETDNDQSAAISVTQAEPGKKVICLSKATSLKLNCYEATGMPMQLTDQNFTQYQAKKYELSIRPDGKGDSSANKTAPDNGDAAGHDTGQDRQTPDSTVQDTNPALRSG